jgi:RsiW-degrading membrane proteinase PrsW (M82 family)
MLEQLINFLASGFVFPGISWDMALIGIGLGLGFGVIWLLGYWPPLIKKPWLWSVMTVSAFIPWVAVAFIQIPLQLLTGQAMVQIWGQETVIKWILVTGIPSVLYSGLVQEGAKLIPMVVWWWREDKMIGPKMGLIIGAIAGAGFGIFEAVGAHNRILAAGWNWTAVQSSGLIALTPFWERLTAVALHISMSALAGYGLAKGWGWQFYLLASFIHAFNNYAAILFQSGTITIIQVEMYATVVAVLVMGSVLWLRWRNSEDELDE